MSATSLSYSALSEVSYVDWAGTDEVPAGWVGVRPLFTGICGTDLLVWHNGHSRAKPPVVLGHEFSGVISRLGADVQGLEVGQLVAVEPLLGCNECERCASGNYNQCAKLRLHGVDVDGSLAPEVLAPAERILVLPADMDPMAGAFIEPTAVVCHLLRRIGALAPGENAFIAGGGPIGLIAAQILMSRGHGVLIAESNPFRADAARSLGAEVVGTFDEALATIAAGEARIGACIEATGVDGALNVCLKAASPGAVIGVVGLPKSEPVVNVTEIIAKELDVRGTRVYTRVDFEEALEVLSSGVLTLDTHITRIVRFEDAIRDGFEAVERREPILKVMIDQREGA